MKQWIDSHIHIKDEPNLSLSALTDAMRSIEVESGLSAFNIAAIPSWDEDHVLQNLLAFYCKSLYNDDIYCFGGLDYYLYPDRPRDCDFEGQLERLLDMGADGVKLIETKPMVRKHLKEISYTDRAYDAFFRKLAEKRLPVLWHVADPETFWHRDQVSQEIIDYGWFYGDGTYAAKETLYSETLSVLDRFPGLQIVFAHMFFLSADLDRADRILDTYPEVRFDITPGGEMYGNFALKREAWRDFFIRRQDRILFGSDGGWTTGMGMRTKIDDSRRGIAGLRRFFETDERFTLCGYEVQGLMLPTEAVEKILYQNFLNLVGGKPRPVNRPSVAAYGKQLIERLNASALPAKEALSARAAEIIALLEGR